MKQLLAFLCGFSLFISTVCLAVTLTLHFRPLYYYDIKALDIPGQSGIEENRVRENYDALIDYNSFFSENRLVFPSLPMSPEGSIHFAEVKRIFLSVETMAVFFALLSALGIYFLRRRRPDWLLWAAGFSLGIPAAVGLMIAVNWEGTFLLMHRLLFENTYWVFDPETDPVICILPSEFFMHCGIVIVTLVILAAAAEIVLWKFSAKKKPKGKKKTITLLPEEEKQPALR